MKPREPGEPEGPALLFGGPCSNLQATRALLVVAPKAGIPAGRMICTGDTVAYGADPVETVAEIRAAAMVAAGLTQGYDAALLSGYWPSEEVLPPDLRRAGLVNG